jgi:hypothetical protein
VLLKLSCVGYHMQIPKSLFIDCRDERQMKESEGETLYYKCIVRATGRQERLRDASGCAMMCYSCCHRCEPVTEVDEVRAPFVRCSERCSGFRQHTAEPGSPETRLEGNPANGEPLVQGPTTPATEICFVPHWLCSGEPVGLRVMRGTSY